MPRGETLSIELIKPGTLARCSCPYDLTFGIKARWGQDFSHVGEVEFDGVVYPLVAGPDPAL